MFFTTALLLMGLEASTSWNKVAQDISCSVTSQQNVYDYCESSTLSFSGLFVTEVLQCYVQQLLFALCWHAYKQLCLICCNM
jgi:hypothetical protein